jgi:hypothetical protein
VTRYQVDMTDMNESRVGESLEHMLQRSDALYERLNTLLDEASFDGSSCAWLRWSTRLHCVL